MQSSKNYMCGGEIVGSPLNAKDYFSQKNVLLKICRKNPTVAEKEQLKDQIAFYSTKDKREYENDVVGMLFIINEKQVMLDYVIPDSSGGQLKPSGQIL